MNKWMGRRGKGGRVLVWFGTGLGSEVVYNMTIIQSGYIYFQRVDVPQYERTATNRYLGRYYFTC